MHINDFINFKFLSNLYLKLKEQRLTSIEVRIQELHQEIEKEKKLLDKKTATLEKLVEENTLIKKDYHRILNLFYNENKTISIRNNNYDISPWENVYLKKKPSHYVIQTKKEQDIYIFSEDLNSFLEYFLTISHSMIVLSVDKKRIVIQIRL
jgi:hypothetical protein